MAGALSRGRPAPDRRPPDRSTATSTASSRPAPTCTTTCTKRAASATTSDRRTPTMPRWRTSGSIASTTPTPAKRSSSRTTTGLPTSRRRSSSGPYTSREFLYLLGGHLWKTTGADGILTAAYRANVPIFCPAIADSSIGMGLSQARQQKAGAGHIDIIGDIVESANMVIRRPRTASVVLGGGTPKNFINQASVQAEFYSAAVGGHRYALQIVTDVPHFGGASGSTPRGSAELGQAGHRRGAGLGAGRRDDRAAAARRARWPRPRRRCWPGASRRCSPWPSRVMTIDGQTVPADRFEEVNEPAV